MPRSLALISAEKANQEVRPKGTTDCQNRSRQQVLHEGSRSRRQDPLTIQLPLDPEGSHSRTCWESCLERPWSTKFPLRLRVCGAWFKSVRPLQQFLH